MGWPRQSQVVPKKVLPPTGVGSGQVEGEGEGHPGKAGSVGTGGCKLQGGDLGDASRGHTACGCVAGWLCLSLEGCGHCVSGLWFVCVFMSVYVCEHM